MSNSSKTGFIDRRVPQRDIQISVQSVYNKIYRDAEMAWMNDLDRQKTEYEANRSALKKLDFQDKAIIETSISELSKNRKIQKFGDKSALELIAKLGVFLSKLPKKAIE